MTTLVSLGREPSTPLICNPMHRLALRALGVIVMIPFASLIPQLAQACATCGCTLSADAGDGLLSRRGMAVER